MNFATISLTFNRMDNFGVFLIKGLKEVAFEYFQAKTVDNIIQYNERVFCYELYHQLRLLDRGSLPNYSINGEIPKQLQFPSIGDYGIYTNIKYDFTDIDKHRITPDIVIHESQENKDGQHLIIEVKNSKNKVTTIDWDLYKLLVYVDKLNFKKGVYIQVNRPIDDLFEDIKNRLIQSEKIGLFRKIIVMSVIRESKENKVSYCSLHDIW